MYLFHRRHWRLWLFILSFAAWPLLACDNAPCGGTCTDPVCVCAP